ncbi:sensor histidine kinase [Pseudoalteromonas rubra]|uniref:sensor histidine kinase n=1 Tax=Pseudoalteromonas rubra TaxID=43658 RepID=UPI000F774EB1|nr:HAMP domain-containing sensor histidine kinase [Pseudoalteromonas rubra]
MWVKDKQLMSYAQRKQQLRWQACAFLLCLLLPLSVLFYFGFAQLKQNQLSAYQEQARNLISQIDRQMFKRRLLSSSLPVEAFDYYQAVYNPLTEETLQIPSVLSHRDPARPTATRPIQGLVGYFQFDAQGQFNSPIWPDPLSAKDLTTSTTEQQQSSVELQQRYERAKFIYQTLLKSSALQTKLTTGLSKENGLYQLWFDVPGYFIFYRLPKVGAQRKLQGYLVRRAPYLLSLVSEYLSQSQFDQPIVLTLKADSSASSNKVHNTMTAQPEQVHFLLSRSQTSAQQLAEADIAHELRTQTLYSAPLRWPFNNYTLHFTTHTLPMSQTMLYGSVFALLLIVIILGACYGFYWLSVRQLALAEQRMNFVSSVSHELKTPLTAIRMYAEMLRTGTVVCADAQQDYYGFIHSESERLSRLIDNILLLTRLNQDDHNDLSQVKPDYAPLSMLADIIRSKTSTLLENQGFTLNMVIEPPLSDKLEVLVDQDAFAQVVINIVENTIKFFAAEGITDPARKQLDITFRRAEQSHDTLELEIRDYGPGVSQQQCDKLFELFYRGGSELTRTTQGTGIGLALVTQLMKAQQGRVSAHRMSPGLALRLQLPIKPDK